MRRWIASNVASITSPTQPDRPTADSGIQFALVDLGSSNGSFLRIRNEIDLATGDHFRVGQQLFRVDFAGLPPSPGNVG